MKKIKIIFLFIVVVAIISFIVLTFVGMTNVSSNKKLEDSIVQNNIIPNKEYIKKEDTNITSREIYLNYDNDNLDNNSELRESTSIFYSDTDNDGVFDDLEIALNLIPNNPISNSVKIKDGTMLYLFGNETYKPIPDENKKIVNENLGITITNIDEDSLALGILEQETGTYINHKAEKAFLLKNINKGASVSVLTQSKTPYVIAINKIFSFKKSIPFNFENGSVTFTHDGNEYIYIIGEKDNIQELENKEFIIINSKVPIIGGYKIFEKAKTLSGNKNFTLDTKNIKVDEDQKIKVKSLGKITGFIVDSISNNYSLNIYSGSMLSKEKLTTSIYDIEQNKTEENNEFIKNHAFNIDNFSTELMRQNVGNGLAYSLFLFNKEIKNNAKHKWDASSSIGVETTYDFTRDLKGYQTILNNNFGQYSFSTKLTERQNLDTTFNPDQQVLRFIEMYSNVFELNKNKYLVSNKYSVDNIDLVMKSIDEENLPIFGLKSANGGYYLTGYKYEKSEFSDNILKVYVYDPNFRQNTLNGKNISDKLILYLIKTPMYKITNKGERTLTYTMQYYYNPFSIQEYSFNNIDNKNSDLDIFLIK